MRCLFFGFYLTLYELISPAVLFLFCFWLSLAPPCSVLLKNSFQEAPSFLATRTCCFALQTEATHLTVVVEKRAYGHTTSLFVMAHRNVGLSSSCMLDPLRLSFSCTAAVLFLVQIEHLYLGPSFSHCCLSTQSRQNLSPCPTFHSHL